MYKHIICPIDGSLTSEYGIEHAMELAKEQGSTIFFLHVVESFFPIVDGNGDVSYIDIADKLEENGKKILLRAKEIAKLSGISVRTKLVFSNDTRIYKSVLNHINKCHADLIVMGTHGLKGIERLVMSSNAEAVVRISPIPVLLVKSQPKEKKKSHFTKHI